MEPNSLVDFVHEGASAADNRHGKAVQPAAKAFYWPDWLAFAPSPLNASVSVIRFCVGVR
jgi:hypothetical protein